MIWFAKIVQSVRTRVSQFREWANGEPRRPCGPRIRCERVEDIPEEPQSATLYVAGEEPHLWAAALLCPCGCGDVIHLNLLEQESPCWTIRRHPDGTVSVVPSVWRTKGCRSHFFIRNNRIDWCRLAGSSASTARR